MGVHRSRFAILLVLVLLTQCIGVSAWGAETQAVTVADGTGVVGYSSLETALENASAGAFVQLETDVYEDVTVDQALLYLDLNGKSIHGTVTVVADCTLYALDSQTDDYTVEDEFGYGKIAAKAGEGVLAGLPAESDVAQDGYLMVTAEEGISFHRVNLQIHTMTLRASECGIYFKSDFSGDEIVAGKVTRFGVALNAVGVPEDFNMGVTSSYSVYTNFRPGAEGNSTRLSTLLKNVLKTTNAPLLNNTNARRGIYGRAYIYTDEGYFFGEVVSRSFREQVEAVDKLWDGLKDSQKAPIVQMYKSYTSLMSGWSVDAIKSAAG